jgi:hypothetical protein
VGINVVEGVGIAQVREAVRGTLFQFLAPLGADAQQQGWPLRKAVNDRELLAVASRVQGVLSVNNVLIAEGNLPASAQIGMRGLELPRVMGISVTVGEPASLEELRGQSSLPPGGAAGGDDDGEGGPGPFLPVPVIPEEC